MGEVAARGKLAERVDEPLLDACRAPFGNQVYDELAVRGRLEDRPMLLQPAAQFLEVHQIAVMGERKPSGLVLGDQRLAVLERGGTGGRVAVVADRAIA